MLFTTLARGQRYLHPNGLVAVGGDLFRLDDGNAAVEFGVHAHDRRTYRLSAIRGKQSQCLTTQRLKLDQCAYRQIAYRLFRAHG